VSDRAGGHAGSYSTRHGDPWLKGALGQAAVAASRTKDTYLAARYRDLGSDHHQRITDPAAQTRALVRQLESLGHQVALTPTS
jgi:hypothetical protein